MVHGNFLCYECYHDRECGETTREGCQTIKVDDLRKLIKVGIFNLINWPEKRQIRKNQRGLMRAFLFQLKTKSDAIQSSFKNAIAEVEQNTSAILDAIMNKAGLQLASSVIFENIP